MIFVNKHSIFMLELTISPLSSNAQVTEDTNIRFSSIWHGDALQVCSVLAFQHWDGRRHGVARMDIAAAAARISGIVRAVGKLIELFELRQLPKLLAVLVPESGSYDKVAEIGREALWNKMQKNWPKFTKDAVTLM